MCVYVARMSSVPVIAPSALRHGITTEDILHAWRNPIYFVVEMDGFLMLIGPSYSARILEIGFVESDDVTVIIHSMPARNKYLR